MLLSVFNTRRPAPAPITGVELQLLSPVPQSEPIALSAQAAGSDQYEVAGDQFDAAGEWQVTVTVKRAGLPDATYRLPWTVTEAYETARRPVVVSNRPLAPMLTVGAELLAFLIVLACLVARFGGRASKRVATGLDRSGRRPGQIR